MKKIDPNKIKKIEIINEQSILDKANKAIEKNKDILINRLESSKKIKTSHIQNNNELNALRENSMKLLEKYELVKDKLIFGRIDLLDGQCYHIGKIGVKDIDHKNLVLDWRAPVAGKYYQSTPKENLGLSRKRSIKIENNNVTSISDELYDDKLKDCSVMSSNNLLIDSILSSKGEKMQSVVNTIQVEQDKIIRDTVNKAIVVSGAPGTGKTVVALHRAAYLLYTERDILSKKGVLIVGPSKDFNNYISDVLPSLGEGYARVATFSELYGVDNLEVYEDDRLIFIKSKSKMSDFLKKGVINEIKLPNEDLVIDFIDIKVRMSKDYVKKVLTNTAKNMENYNEGRVTALSEIINKVIENMILLRGEDPNDEYIKIECYNEIRESKNAKRVLNLLWMPRTPEEMMVRFLGNTEKVITASEGILSKEELSIILKNIKNWNELKLSIYDVPLLDELYFLLGQIPYNISNSYSMEDDDNYEILDNEHWYNKEWKYGHVIVDEAQNVSEMEWRMILRRMSNKSITISGDDQQKITPACTIKLSDMESIITNIKYYELNINYRTPAEIINWAEGELCKKNIKRKKEIVSVRSEAGSLVFLNNYEELGEIKNFDGSIAIISNSKNYSNNFESITALESQGREFDYVILDYRSLKYESINTLYVASTRANKKLFVVGYVG